MSDGATESGSGRGRKSSRKAGAKPDAGTAEASGNSSEPANGNASHYSATIRLPFLTAHLEVPKPSRPHLPELQAPDFSKPVRIGPVAVPAPPKTVYYLGLGALAVAEIVEWPIAAAIAAGTYVAQHTRDDAPAAPQLQHDEATHTA